MIPSCPFSPEERAFIRGFIHGVDMRIGALERRVYKLEDVVNEILRRGAGVGELVNPGTEQRLSDLAGRNEHEGLRQGEGAG